MSERLIKALYLLQQKPEEPIRIILNSFGGCWYNGMAIYDAIRSCPAHVTIEVFGAAMSMGSIILQAADERVIHPNATIMVHDGYETRVGDIPKTFENWADYSKVTRRKMYEIYAEKSGKTVQFWEKRCQADFILSATQAKELKLVDKIVGEK
jgi:ATP-dependent Clp protease protease subunit